MQIAQFITPVNGVITRQKPATIEMVSILLQRIAEMSNAAIMFILIVFVVCGVINYVFTLYMYICCIITGFYSAMLRRTRYCHGKSSVRPSRSGIAIT